MKSTRNSKPFQDDTTSETGGRARSIQSLDRAAALLNAVAAAPDGLSLTALAAAAGLAPQTAQSLVRTLQTHGWMAQAGRGRPYTLGPGLLTLARRWSERGGPAAAARAVVEELSQATGEYALLAELRGRTIMPLVERRAERTLMLGNTETYGPERLHIMATAKVLLAYLDPARRDRLVDGLELTVHGPNSVRSRASLLRHLDGIRRQGHAVCREEAGEQVAALAVPVRDAAGVVCAALGISLPLLRLTRVREKELLRQLRAAAAAIEQRWGLPATPGTPIA